MEQREQLAWTLFGLAILLALFMGYKWTTVSKEKNIRATETSRPEMISKDNAPETPNDDWSSETILIETKPLIELYGKVGPFDWLDLGPDRGMPKPSVALREITNGVDKLKSTLQAIYAAEVSPVTDDYLMLSGYKDVEIKVSVSDELKNIIDISTIKTKAELKLRSCGISVVDKSRNRLYIAIEGAPPNKESNQYLYNIETNVYAKAVIFLPDNVPKGDILTIWDKGTFGYTSTKAQCIEAISDSAERHIEKFANDYLKANPKK